MAIGEDGQGMVWTASEGGSWSGASIVVAKDAVIAAAFSGNGQFLVVSTVEGVQAWALDAQGALQRHGQLVRTEQTPTALAITDTGDRMALGMPNGDVMVRAVE
jgi:hypothetical protein